MVSPLRKPESWRGVGGISGVVKVGGGVFVESCFGSWKSMFAIGERKLYKISDCS